MSKNKVATYLSLYQLCKYSATHALFYIDVNNSKKRPLCTRKIIDNKRKHLEKPLSAAKRDEVLLRAAREDIELKKKQMEHMQESQKALVDMAKSMSASLDSLGKSVSDGLGMLAMALNPNAFQNASIGSIPHTPPPMPGFYQPPHGIGSTIAQPHGLYPNHTTGFPHRGYCDTNDVQSYGSFIEHERCGSSDSNGSTNFGKN